MTDDEINLKVAEIEGWSPSPKEIDAEYYAPPYVTDWAWCGPLVGKHNLEVWPMAKRWRAQQSVLGPASASDTPQRAICLAVIAAHE